MLTALLPAELADLVGAVTAVVAGLLLWVLAARLRVGSASRTAVVALYAGAVLAVEVGSGPGVDGTGLLLLVAAAVCAVGGGTGRTVIALVLLVGAVVVMPGAGAGVLVLLSGMALTGDLGRRTGAVPRFVAAAVGSAGAVAVVIVVARPEEPAALPTAVPAALSLWGVLVVGVLWRRLPWLRPVGAAVLAMLVCVWVPGPDADATLVAAAAVALSTVLAAEDMGAAPARRALGAVAVGAVVAGTLLLTPTVSGPGTGPGSASFVLPDRPGGVDVAVAAAPVPFLRPVRVTIPAIGVSSPLEDLVADPVTRELAAPADPSLAGWFAAGVVPGRLGPAVIGGHVDSRRGPGVFFRLRDLRPGNAVAVARSDGSTVHFAVIAVRRYPKTAFPTDAVYGPTAGPELRLVTCGGQFDRSARSYDDNVVVDAVLG